MPKNKKITKTQEKYLTTFLGKHRRKDRPVLNQWNYQGEKIVFTDGYIMIELYNTGVEKNIYLNTGIETFYSSLPYPKMDRVKQPEWRLAEYSSMKISVDDTRKILAEDKNTYNVSLTKKELVTVLYTKDYKGTILNKKIFDNVLLLAKKLGIKELEIKFNPEKEYYPITLLADDFYGVIAPIRYK